MESFVIIGDFFLLIYSSKRTCTLWTREEMNQIKRIFKKKWFLYIFKAPQFFCSCVCLLWRKLLLTGSLTGPHLAFSTLRSIPTSPALCKWSYPAPKERKSKAHLHLPHIQPQPQVGSYMILGDTPLFFGGQVSPSVLHATSFPPPLSSGINSKFLGCEWHLY